jgi:hypothetical protein
MPVSIVWAKSSLSCSWYSSTMAQLGLAPSPGLPISGSNREAVPAIAMLYLNGCTP